MSTTATLSETGYELKIVRTFDAPRDLVWKAWTDPGMAKRWMGPRGFQTTEFVTSSEVGSSWRLCMDGRAPHTGEKITLCQGGKTLEFVPPEKLVYTFAWDGRSKVGLGESPFKENIVTVRFEEKGNKTVMHFTQGPFATEGERDGHNGGWNSAFDRFAEFMLAEQPKRTPDPNDVPSELHIKRFFAAPRAMVFDAWMKPEHVEQWWGPRMFNTTVETLEARGGAILFHMHGPDGVTHSMKGRFLEVIPPLRLHFTAAALDPQGEPYFENWNSVFFEEVEGGTMVTLDVHVMSATDEAGKFLKGMSAGWSSTLDRLEEFVTKQA